MHLSPILLVTLITILAWNSVLVAATEKTIASLVDHVTGTGYDGVNQGRFRRTASANNNVAGAADSLALDERANPITSFLKEIPNKIPLSWKTTWWLDRYKSVDYVEEKLGMKGLTNAEKLVHKNYNRLERYSKKLKENIIWRAVRRDVSTYRVWDDLGLNQKTTLHPTTTTWSKVPDEEILAQLAKIQKTEAFKEYKQYAVAYDAYKVSLFGSGYYRPTVFFDKNATPLEKMARIQIWVETKRPTMYVKEFLGLQHAKADKLRNDRFYQFYSRELTKAGVSGY